MRRPTVLTMRQPPSAVPERQRGGAGEHGPRAAPTGSRAGRRRPAAPRSRPTAFWASLAPWLNASAGGRHPLAGAHGRRASAACPCARPALQRARSRASAASAPSTGETASAIAVPMTPTGRRPSSPPHCTASAPPSTSAAPTRPPTSAWPELDGSPSHQVSAFHATAASSPARDHGDRRRAVDRDDAADRVRDRRADEQRSEQC